MAPDTRHEYENVGPDTQTISPGYVPPRLPPPKPDHLQPVQPVTEQDEEEGGEDGVTSINYIVLDLDPASSSEASAVTQASKTGDSVPNSAGKDDSARCRKKH